MTQLPVLVQAVVRTVDQCADFLVSRRCNSTVDNISDAGGAPLAREEGHIGILSGELGPTRILVPMDALRVATLLAEEPVLRVCGLPMD